MPPFTIHLIADDPLARAGLASLLASHTAVSITAQFTLPQWLQDSEETDYWAEAPDVILWDLGWELPDELPNLLDYPLPFVALLATPSDAVPLWEVGVRTLLPRHTPAAQLAAALQTAVAGFAILAPEMLPHLLTPATPTPDTAVDPLTSRESQVLQLVAEGLTNKAIAQRLAISDHTVKFHINAIMTKLNAQSRTQAVVRATQLGLILL
jgi:DNA-binding NarL/FixJ family response regulator